ncbi:MAG: hypothetical protein ACI3YC_04960, partial [Alloprevotella sp.]
KINAFPVSSRLLRLQKLFLSRKRYTRRGLCALKKVKESKRRSRFAPVKKVKGGKGVKGVVKMQRKPPCEVRKRRDNLSPIIGQPLDNL